MVAPSLIIHYDFLLVCMMYPNNDRIHYIPIIVLMDNNICVDLLYQKNENLKFEIIKQTRYRKNNCHKNSHNASFFLSKT